jgi:hypothetical protein
VNAEDRVAESTAMARLDHLLDERLSAVQHVRESLGCCARPTSASGRSTESPPLSAAQ